MELHQLNNSVSSGVNHASMVHTQKTIPSEAIEEVKSSPVEVSLNSKNDIRSELANSVGKYIKTISTASSVTSILKGQMEAINNIQDKISTVTKGVSTQDSIQPDIAQLVSKYNSSTGVVNDKIDRLSDLKGDSTTYFDGSAGAIPLNIDMLNNSMATKRKELASTIDKVNEVNEVFKELAKNVITSEVQKLQEASPFKEINFGKESVDFNSANMNNLMGSVASSQANAMPTQNIRLLS